MMTEALMGLYPDVFKAGAEMSGVPDGCWAVDDPSGGWSGPCAGGMVSMTAMEWGDLVRAQYPGYAGPRPRLWLWVGTADPIISPNNFGESILEWTNVLGLSATPTSTETPDAGYTGQLWNNSCDRTVLEGWTLDGGGHAPVPSPQNANAIVTFFGLDTSGPDLGAGCADAGGSSDAGTGGGDASMMGADASRGGGGDASIPGSDGGVHDSDAGARRIDAGAVDSDGGGASHGDSGGCGCRVGPTEGRSLAALAAPIGAILGIVLRRRRRLRGRERQFR
jgi:acetylxylan esterase